MIKFQFGRKIKSLKELITLSAILHGTLDALALVTRQSKQEVFNRIDNPHLTEIIINDNELLSYRINKVLDEALKND